MLLLLLPPHVCCAVLTLYTSGLSGEETHETAPSGGGEEKPVKDDQSNWDWTDVVIRFWTRHFTINMFLNVNQCKTHGTSNLQGVLTPGAHTPPCIGSSLRSFHIKEETMNNPLPLTGGQDGPPRWVAGVHWDAAWKSFRLRRWKLRRLWRSQVKVTEEVTEGTEGTLSHLLTLRQFRVQTSSPLFN